MVQLHANELKISHSQVRQLIDAQFPEYQHLAVAPLGSSGSSNVLYRLGDELLIRLPRQPGGGVSLHKEQKWTALVGKQLPVTVPTVVALGEPGFGYPEPWAVVSWLPGEHPNTPEKSGPPGSGSVATQLAELLIAFRQLPVSEEATADPTLTGQYRGKRLTDYDQQMRLNVNACRTIKGLQLDLDSVLEQWEQALALPETDAVEPSWFHGDLVAENLLMNNGAITALLDFGGLGIGDPAVDLHGAWELLDTTGRAELRTLMEVEEAQWQRGRAWALAIAVMTLPYYWHTMPGRVTHRLVMARAALMG